MLKALLHQFMSSIVYVLAIPAIMLAAYSFNKASLVISNTFAQIIP